MKYEALFARCWCGRPIPSTGQCTQGHQWPRDEGDE